MSLFKWFKGTKSNKLTNTLVVPEGNVVIARLPDNRYQMFITDGQRQMRNLPQLSHVYPFDQPTTVKVGGINAGSVLKDLDVADVLQQILSEYQAVVLNSFTVSPSSREIGQALSGTIQVVCNVTNLQNVNPGASTIISSGPSLFSEQQINPATPNVISVTSHTKNTPGNVTITVTVRGINGESSARNVSLPWFAPIVFGSHPDLTIDTQTQYNQLTGKKLQNARQSVNNFPGGGYSHLLIPKTISISGIGFIDIDIATGNPLFTYGMQQQTDRTFNNGFVDVNFWYFRSTNFQNAATRMQVI